MADQSDVENALVSQIQAILYPNGFAATSAIGAVCRVYRGWPLSAALNADLAAGLVNCSVLPVANSVKPVTSFNDGWVGDVIAPGMSATASGDSVTFAGTAGAGQLAGMLVNGVPYVYRSEAGDCLANVAAALAALISETIEAFSTGATVYVPSAASISGVTAANFSLWQEIRRQRQEFSIAIYSPTPQLRDTATALVDLSLAGKKFIGLTDGSDCRILFKNTVSQDQNQVADVYRRDLIYQAEYATTVTMTSAQMMFGGLGINGVTNYT